MNTQQQNAVPSLSLKGPVMIAFVRFAIILTVVAASITTCTVATVVGQLATKMAASAAAQS
jgi:hypothetical protein